MSTASLRDEVTDLLQRLIRVDTTNPPGNETAAAELLRDYLEANGIDCELIAKVPERANLVARIPGGDGPSLLFLGHTDVVLANPAEWSVPPFSGELRDGLVWGRGALDMKSEVAANAVAMASLAREGFRPSGERSMIDSLRCASITLPSLDAHTSESSGPRWIRVSAIRSPNARSADSGCARPTIPAIPHISASSHRRVANTLIQIFVRARDNPNRIRSGHSASSLSADRGALGSGQLENAAHGR